MKRITLLITLALLLTAACNNRQADSEPTPSPVDTIPMMVTQIQQCSRLYTTEYHVHKIITHDDKMKVSGSFMKRDFSVNLPLGDRRIAISVPVRALPYRRDHELYPLSDDAVQFDLLS